MSMKAALHDQIELLSDEDAEQLLASLRGYKGDAETMELVRRFEQAREGFWRDEYASDAEFDVAVRQGAKALLALLQPAELELAASLWAPSAPESVSDRQRLINWVTAAPVDEIAKCVDYLNNRLDPDELLPIEEGAARRSV